MNPHQLKRLFPQASAATLSANAGDYGDGLPEQTLIKRPVAAIHEPPARVLIAGEGQDKLQHPNDTQETGPVPAEYRSDQPERGPLPPLALAGAAQADVGGRILVRITVRKCGILQDPDNCFVKPLVDQLRHCGLIPDDAPGVIKLEVEQTRVKTKAEQGTEVEIIWP